MLEETVGSVAVCEGERLVGIFTERDVLRLAGEGPNFAEVKVGDVMTRQLVTLAPDDDILDAARLMGERKIRHLPVLEGENLLGIVGIREVVRALVERCGARTTPRPASAPASSSTVRAPRYPQSPRARSSAGERPLHTREVAGSIPAAPTHRAKSVSAARCASLALISIQAREPPRTSGGRLGARQAPLRRDYVSTRRRRAFVACAHASPGVSVR